MIIAGTVSNLNQRAVEVYLRGCLPPHCKGCHNEDLHNFSGFGKHWEEVLQNLEYKPLRQKVFIMGGEPQDQRPELLLDFCSGLKEKGFEIWLFTRYYSVKDERLLPLLDYVKFGDYQEEDEPTETEYGITLASRNQYIKCLHQH